MVATMRVRDTVITAIEVELQPGAGLLRWLVYSSRNDTEVSLANIPFADLLR